MNNSKSEKDNIRNNNNNNNNNSNKSNIKNNKYISNVKLNNLDSNYLTLSSFNKTLNIQLNITEKKFLNIEALFNKLKNNNNHSTLNASYSLNFNSTNSLSSFGSSAYGIKNNNNSNNNLINNKSFKNLNMISDSSERDKSIRKIFTAMINSKGIQPLYSNDSFSINKNSNNNFNSIYHSSNSNNNSTSCTPYLRKINSENLSLKKKHLNTITYNAKPDSFNDTKSFSPFKLNNKDNNKKLKIKTKKQKETNFDYDSLIKDKASLRVKPLKTNLNIKNSIKIV